LKAVGQNLEKLIGKELPHEHDGNFLPSSPGE